LNWSGGYLKTPDEGKGHPVYVTRRAHYEGSQEWEVWNQGDGSVVIRHPEKDIYLVPENPKNIHSGGAVVPGDSPYPWIVRYDTDKSVYMITTRRFNVLILGASSEDSPNVEFEYSDGVPSQEWEFVPIGKPDHRLQTCTRSGPWRIPRFEFQLE
jgi:hypothetical protein